MNIHPMRLGAALCVGAALLPLKLHAGDCAPQFPRPRIVTPDGAAIPVGGGILVEHTTNTNGAALEAAPIKAWRFAQGKRRVAPKERELAPGLTVLEVAGTSLENGRGHTLRGFTRAKDGPVAPTVPKVKAVELVKSHAGYRVNTHVTVELEEAIPAALFLVVFDGEGKPRSFGRSQRASTSVEVYSAGECITSPQGTLPTHPGDTVRLAWVDDTGLMSPMSEAKTVKAAARDGPPSAP